MRALEPRIAEARSAAHQSRFYTLLAPALRTPRELLHAALVEGSFDRDLDECLGGLPFAVATPAAVGRAVPSLEELGRLYSQEFEVGGPAGPPCLLYEAEYGGGRLKVMEDVLRFYDHFGVEPSDGDEWRDRPDHLAAEVEFVHYLAFREAEVADAGGDPAPWRTGRRDFLRLHLCDVADAVAARMTTREVPVYTTVCALLAEVARGDLYRLLRSGS